jgi:MFS transporter, ACS family, allantoate permease
MQASFLTEDERILAVHRIRTNKTGILNRQLKWKQVQEALNPLQDPQGLLLFLIIFCNEVLKSVIRCTFL